MHRRLRRSSSAMQASAGKIENYNGVPVSMLSARFATAWAERRPFAARRFLVTADRFATRAGCPILFNSINVIVRGKAGAEVEFGNKLWLGETREGIIVDYKLYQDNPGDPALVRPAIQRLLVKQEIGIKHAWGDRGLASKANKELLE